MAKVRSPNYPNVSLGPALEAMRVAYSKENRNKMSREVLAKHLGYSSLNGRALGKIGAVRAYGLIEGSGDELRVSDDAISALMAPPGAPERSAALERLALRPGLFQELRKDFPNTLPNIDNLKFLLIKRNFIPEAAEKAAKSYLATMSLVAGNPGEYSDENEEGDDAQDENDTPPPPLNRNKRREVKSGMKEDVFSLSEGDVVLQWPEGLSQESYEDVEAWTKLILRKIKRSIDAGEQPQNDEAPE